MKKYVLIYLCSLICIFDDILFISVIVYNMKYLTILPRLNLTIFVNTILAAIVERNVQIASIHFQGFLISCPSKGE